MERLSDEVDVALLRIDMRGRKKIPVLGKLDHTERGAKLGEPVILLGYPAGK